ncbi:MAG: DNA-directed RNA polymerase subunit omega [Zetaproteobacteria bacterium]|nr:DNA-directed RNA polymerase subunit omega [Zetaproteobacteria bacterium]
MARVTVEDCVKHYPNRFEMVYLASRRARQLIRGMEPMSENMEKHKPSVQALKELGEGFVTWDVLHALDDQEKMRMEAASHLQEL